MKGTKRVHENGCRFENMGHIDLIFSCRVPGPEVQKTKKKNYVSLLNPWPGTTTMTHDRLQHVCQYIGQNCK